MADPHTTAREALHALADRIPATENAEREYDLAEQALDALAADLTAALTERDRLRDALTDLADADGLNKPTWANPWMRARAALASVPATEEDFPGDCNDGSCKACRRCYSAYVEAKMSGELDRVPASAEEARG